MSRAIKLPRWLWWGMAAVLVLLLVLVINALAPRLMPNQARVQQLLQQADAALANGHLDAADGTGARQLYEAALAIDPDRPESREGLADVALAAAAQAEALIQRGQIDAAAEALALAQSLRVPRQRAQAIAAQIQRNQHDDTPIDALLLAAEQARIDRHYDGAADAALPLYQRILQRDPQQLDALEGREDVLSELLQQAQQALANAQWAQAAKLLQTVRRYDAGHMDLPAVQEAFTASHTALHQRAEQARQAGQLEQAKTYYQQLLQMDPNDAQAAQAWQALTQPHTDAQPRSQTPSTQAQQTHLSAAQAAEVGRARQCFARELARNSLGRSQDCLQQWQRLQGDDPRLAQSRQRLAERWLAVGEERLGASELDAAVRALQQAQQLAPQLPGLPAFAQRVQQAQQGDNAN